MELRIGFLSLALAAVPGALLAPLTVTRAQAQAKRDADAAAKGAVVYVRYCVACHGTGGRGDGSLAGDLRVPVPDVTTLAARSAGRFPEARVERIIQSGEAIGIQGYPLNYAVPLYPQWMHGDIEETNPGTPRHFGQGLLMYPYSWTFHFSLPTAVASFPNIF